ncbi:MAG TPA: SCO1664 family protein [Actinomycetota bacterium]|nr:SCO1664 family protein [Actinomycetota bacterium]
MGEAAPAVLDLLSRGEVEVLGLLPYSSNYTFLARVGVPDGETLAVYKPRRGERPLWDFPHGTLAAREVAAYAVAEAAGWGFVPPTVLRDDAPLGAGSLQLFVEHDPERHYFVLFDERPDDFEPFVAFDAVVNNADRKGGHVLEDRDGRLWAVDHGLSFHVEPKLRTVIWEFADEPLGDAVRAALARLRGALDGGPLRAELAALLAPDEVAATARRVAELLAAGRYPAPAGDRPLPWPLV